MKVGSLVYSISSCLEVEVGTPLQGMPERRHECARSCTGTTFFHNRAIHVDCKDKLMRVESNVSSHSADLLNKLFLNVFVEIGLRS